MLDGELILPGDVICARVCGPSLDGKTVPPCQWLSMRVKRDKEGEWIGEFGVANFEAPEDNWELDRAWPFSVLIMPGMHACWPEDAEAEESENETERPSVFAKTARKAQED